jgi:hypothetical protein
MVSALRSAKQFKLFVFAPIGREWYEIPPGPVDIEELRKWYREQGLCTAVVKYESLRAKSVKAKSSGRI